MHNRPALPDNGPMTERQASTLFDQAVDLAYKAFAEPDDEHVLAIYSRLLWNWQRGLADAGAVTVH